MGKYGIHNRVWVFCSTCNLDSREAMVRSRILIPVIFGYDRGHFNNAINEENYKKKV